MTHPDIGAMAMAMAVMSGECEASADHNATTALRRALREGDRATWLWKDTVLEATTLAAEQAESDGVYGVDP